METIKDMLLEKPFWTISVLVLAQIVLAAVWYEKKTLRRLWLLLMPAVAGCLLLLLGMFVQSDSDRILSAAGAIASDIQNGRSQAMEDFLSDNFVGIYEGASLNKASAIAKCHQEKNRHQIKEIRISDPEIVVKGRHAEMTVATHMTVDTELGSFKAKVIFKLTWVKTDNRWVIWHAQEPQVQRHY